MKEIISTLRYDKVKTTNEDGSESARMSAYMVGVVGITPKMGLVKVDKITLKEEGSISFTIQFTNGERLIVYPIAPFDYGTEIIKEDKDERTRK